MVSSGGEQSASGRTRISSLMRWVGTLGLGTYIVLQSDLESSWALLRNANGLLILLAVALYGIDRLAAAAKWRLLMVAKGHAMPLLEALSIYLESSFLGAILPATIGADLIRARLAQRHAGTFANSLSAVIVERFAGLVALGAAALLGLVVFAPEAYRRMTLTLSLWAVVAGGLTWLVARGLGRVEFRRSDGRGRALVSRITAFAGELSKRLIDYRGHLGILGVVLALALGQQYLLTGINWILAVALGMDVSLVTMVWVWPIVMLAIRLPVSVMGFGVREILLIELMGSMGVPESAALTLGIASGLLDVLFVLIGGGLVMLRQRSLVEELTQAEDLESGS